MKLHTKLILFLIIGLSIVVFLGQLFQYNTASHRLNQFSQNLQTILTEREDQNARTIFEMLESSVAGSLERGEMEKFKRTLEEQSRVEGILEFSLFSKTGRVTHSSDSSNVNRELERNLFIELTQNPDRRIVNSEQYIEIYQPQVVTPDCIRCHMAWVENEIGGVTYLRSDLLIWGILI